MGAVVALDRLLDGRQLWRGPARQGPASDHLASGHPVLDARLPGGGWHLVSLDADRLPKVDGTPTGLRLVAYVLS